MKCRKCLCEDLEYHAKLVTKMFYKNKVRGYVCPACGVFNKEE